MKILFNRVVLLIGLAFSACSGNDKETLLVKGTVKNLDKTIAMFPDAFRNESLRLYLHEVPFGKDLQPILLDSVTVTAKENSFTLKGQTKGTGIYDVMIENGPMIPLVNDVHEIMLDIDMSDKDKYYTVNGSDASKQLRDFVLRTAKKGL